VSSTSHTVNHNHPKHDTAFYHQNSRFDGNDDYKLNEKIVHYILSSLLLSCNHSMLQASSFLFFPDDFSFHHSLDHLTAKFPSLLESPLVIFKFAKTLLLYSCFLSFSPFLTSLVSGSVLSDLCFVHFFSL